MIEEIIDHYRNNLTFKQLVTEKGGYLAKSFFIVYPAILFLTAIGYLVTYNYYMAAIGILTAIAFLMIYAYNDSRTVKRLYPDLYISPLSWSIFRFRTMINTKLKNHLVDTLKIKDREQIKEISLLIKQKANNERTPYLVSASAFAALFIPLWCVLLDKIFYSIPSSINLFLAVFSVVFLVIVLFSIYCFILVDIRDNFLTRYNSLNRLSESLDDIYLEW